NSHLCNRFIEGGIISVGRPMKLRKQRASLRRVLHHLNDFCQQFQTINQVLDKSISTILVGIYVFLFITPYFLTFVENKPSVRLSFGMLCIITYAFCFSFSICNDRLRRQVSAFG